LARTPQNEILLLEDIHPVADEILTDAGLRIRRQASALDAGELQKLAAQTAFLGIRSKTTIDESVLKALPDLLGIACFCIGTNQVDLRTAARNGSVVFNAPFSNTRSVAEMTISEVIALHRRLFDRSARIHSGHWFKSARDAHEVRGRTLGIIGYGHIGSQVSVLAEALGMKVVYYDVASKMPLGNAQPMDSLKKVLAVADVVTLHVPATPATATMIGKKELSQMKRGAMLINNARGSIVDIVALADAIKNGSVGGAALDVYPEEPTTNDAPFDCILAGLPNVVLTPHIGGSTEEAQESIARDVALKIARFFNTGTTTNAVNVPEVELPLRREDQLRILHFHHNVPGVLSTINGILADLSVNINAEYLQSNADVSYVILDIDDHDESIISTRLKEIPETIRIRFLR
jgi:D-3-phosphoglycerate dehydrogenase